jgi:hypothetical protein
MEIYKVLWPLARIDPAVAAVQVRQDKMVQPMQTDLATVVQEKNGLWVLALTMVAVVVVGDILLPVVMGTAVLAAAVTEETLVTVLPELPTQAVVVVEQALVGRARLADQA